LSWLTACVGDEASLDIQTITGVNQGTPTQFTITPGLHEKQEPFLVWLLAIAGTRNAPLVRGKGEGGCSVDENSLDDSYMTRVDQEFQKLGLLGHTFVYASGDSGVDCTDSNTQVHCGGAHVVLSAVPFLTCLF
jgi:tripeptidyl-peptidase-1